MKTKLWVTTNKCLIAVYTIVLGGIVPAASAVAQVSSSVVESQAFTPAQNSTSSNSDALSLLLDQNRNLQTEVQALRALIEEMGFEQRKLQRDSLSRYTNIDDRLSSLEAAATTSLPSASNPIASGSTPALTRPVNSGPANLTPGNSTLSGDPGSTSAAVEPANTGSFLVSSRRNSTGNPPFTSSGRATLEPAVLSEQQLYQMAYDSVINSNFERSIAEFDQYLSIYTQGRFVTNAYYWKGQAYLYLDRFDEARESYEIILNQYADSPKLPDAMYGLALAYQGLGNIPQAKQLLNDIRRRFPNTGVANLAVTRLLSLD
ncbi:MAG: tetratricopeptide repeat protein [Proteobacteria bacterium]|nr:tetratricopeptide repeat protein [Pseudomonadota bacterium]